MIIEKEDVQKHLIKALRKAFYWDGKKRTGIHVSDLVYCLRKAYWRRQPEYKEDLTSDSVLYFVRGRSLHDLLEKLFPDREVKIEKHGVKGTVDAVDTYGNCVEIKTTKRLWNNEPQGHHVRQLEYYLMMRGVKTGILLYYELEPNNLRVFEIHLTDDDLEAIEMEFIERKAALDTALDESTPDALEYAQESWECKFCEHKKSGLCGGRNNGE